jgi:hypothetical protein
MKEDMKPIKNYRAKNRGGQGGKKTMKGKKKKDVFKPSIRTVEGCMICGRTLFIGGSKHKTYSPCPWCGPSQFDVRLFNNEEKFWKQYRKEHGLSI